MAETMIRFIMIYVLGIGISGALYSYMYKKDSFFDYKVNLYKSNKDYKIIYEEYSKFIDEASIDNMLMSSNIITMSLISWAGIIMFALDLYKFIQYLKNNKR